MTVPEKDMRAEEERVLIAKVARRDTLALERLYSRYRPRLHRFLLGLGCAAAELDELCNETFYVVWRKAGTYDGTSRLSTWIFGIARNKGLDILRREWRRDQHRSDTEPETLPEARIADAERMELGERLAAALELLPDEQRVVVELAFVEGIPYREIARLMDCPEATVKTRMFHARRRLREWFPEFKARESRRIPK